MKRKSVLWFVFAFIIFVALVYLSSFIIFNEHYESVLFKKIPKVRTINFSERNLASVAANTTEKYGEEAKRICDILPENTDRFSRNSSYRLPQHITGAILWPYFEGGLTNQRMKMKDAIFLAAKLKRSIVMSPWLFSRRMQPNSTSVIDWMKVSITRVYDLDYMIECLAQKNISALYPCHPDSCVMNFSPPSLSKSEIEHGLNKSLPFVTAKFDPILSNLTQMDLGLLTDIDACITWSCEVKEIADIILKGIQSKTGKDTFENVVGFHLRVEDDFSWHISSKRKERNITDSRLLSLIPNEVVQCALDCYKTSHVPMNTSQLWAYVASGVPKHSPRIASFKDVFPNVLMKEDFLIATPSLGSDFIAAVDSLVLEQLSYFVGCWSSTFSIQAAINRRSKKLASALYTIDMSCQCFRFYTPKVI